jgi:hypothetical protein
MYQKQKGLSMNCENHTKIYSIETKIVSLSHGGQGQEKKGGKKMGHRFIKLLKTHVEKMSVFRLAIMLQKISRLQSSCHYIDEKKGT